MNRVIICLYNILDLCISIGKFQFYSILSFQKITLSLYYPILQYLQHPKTLFLLKYYFLIFLYYFFPTVTFFSDLVFLGFPTSLSPSTSSTSSTHTYPWYTDQPIQTHHHTQRATHTHKHKPSIHQQSYTHKYKPSNHQQSHTHTNHQTSWSKQRPPHPPPKPPIRNPRRRFETQSIWNPPKQTH